MSFLKSKNITKSINDDSKESGTAKLTGTINPSMFGSNGAEFALGTIGPNST